MPVFPRVLHLLLYPLLALPATMLAQQITLTGTVVEAGTGQPIPFATVELPTRQLGVQATEAGTFTLTLPAKLTGADSLRVGSLGFATRMLAVPSALSSRLELQALPVSLTEVVVQTSVKPLVQLGPTTKAKKLGYLEAGRFSAEGSTGWQIARLFADAPAGYLQAVRYYVEPNENCEHSTVRTPFRVRIYAADGPNASPGTDLLNTTVVTAAPKEGWHEVNLSRYRLDIPATGFYVAMEWLYTQPDFGCEYTADYRLTPNESGSKAKRERQTRYSYGQKLGGYLDATPKLTWTQTIGKPWRQHMLPGSIAKTGNPNAAIQAIVQPD